MASRRTSMAVEVPVQSRSGAQAIYESLEKWEDVQRLIDAGEAEDASLECKAPRAPQLTRDLHAALAEAVSGFSNSAGGVIVWGVETTPHTQTHLDILTALAPIGNARSLAAQVDLALARDCYPRVPAPASRVLSETPRSTRGLIVTFVPPTTGDPVQSLIDRKFYLRSGDAFVEMPYEVLRRMFAAESAPDLHPSLDPRLVKRESDGSWRVPFVLQNDSSAAARDVRVMVTILNPEVCERVVSASPYIIDASAFNPGEVVFMGSVSSPVFRGMNMVVGDLLIAMKKRVRSHRVVKIRIGIFADRMRARQWEVTVQLAQRGFTVRQTSDRYVY